MDKVIPIEKDPNSGYSLPHLSFILHHFLPVYHNCTRRNFTSNDLLQWDELGESSGFTTLLTGSVVEGMDLPIYIHGSETSRVKTCGSNSSGLDIMLISRKNFVTDPENIKGLSAMTEDADLMEIFSEKTHPGYLQLRKKKSRVVSNKNMFIEKESDPGYLYYAPGKVKTEVHETVVPLLCAAGATPDGIELKEDGLTCTFTRSRQKIFSPPTHTGYLEDTNRKVHMLFPVFRCLVWPKAAEEWRTRSRSSNWPTVDLIKEVTNNIEIHIVPVPHPFSAEPELEWRMSFSAAELKLNQSITPIQRQCYLLLKTLYAQALKQPQGLVTYHLKTIFLWVCEEIPVSDWNQFTIGTCLFKLLDFLHKCLHGGNLPSYFIRRNNLIDNINSDVKEELMDKVLAVRRDPLKYLFGFNREVKWSFGIHGIDAESLFKPTLEDAKVSTNLLDSYKIFRAQSVSVVLHYVSEHAIYLKDQIHHGRNADDYAGYTLPYDNALDVLEGLKKMNKEITGEELELLDVILKCAKNLSQYNEALIGFCERALYRYPEVAHKPVLLGNLGCCYHVKYKEITDNEENRRKLEKKTTDLFERCLGNGGGPSAMLDYARFLLTAGKNKIAQEVLKKALNYENINIALGQPSMNTYSGAELSTLNKVTESHAEKQIKHLKTHSKQFSTFTYPIAAYLLIILLMHDKISQAHIIEKLQANCKALEKKFSGTKPMHEPVGNAYLVLTHACKTAGMGREAAKAAAVARKYVAPEMVPL